MIHLSIQRGFTPFTLKIECESQDKALVLRKYLEEFTHYGSSKPAHLFAKLLISQIDSCLPSATDDEEGTDFADEVFTPMASPREMWEEGDYGDLREAFQEVADEEKAAELPRTLMQDHSPELVMALKVLDIRMHPLETLVAQIRVKFTKELSLKGTVIGEPRGFLTRDAQAIIEVTRKVWHRKLNLL